MRGLREKIRGQKLHPASKKGNMKLTPKQNSIIWCLQNKWRLITDSEMKGAICCNKNLQFKISHTLFWNLYDKGLIEQGTFEQSRFGYILTKLGHDIKTKPVTF